MVLQLLQRHVEFVPRSTRRARNLSLASCDLLSPPGVFTCAIGVGASSPASPAIVNKPTDQLRVHISFQHALSISNSWGCGVRWQHQALDWDSSSRSCRKKEEAPAAAEATAAEQAEEAAAATTRRKEKGAAAAAAAKEE